METETLEKVLKYKITSEEATFPAILTGMNWSRNEIMLSIDDNMVARETMYGLLKSIGKFDNIDFIVTLEHKS